MSTEILTDAQGRPFAKPCRWEYATLRDFIEALYAYRDRVNACANESFDTAFRAAIKK